MKGSGQLTLFTRPSITSAYTATKTFDTSDAIFDYSWSELHPSVIALALANGKLAIVNPDTAQLLLQYPAHSKEISSVDWCVLRKDLVVTASWDGTIKVWSPSINPVAPLAAIPGTTNGVVVYEAAWSLHYPDTLLSATSDKQACVWDLSTGSKSPVVTLRGHEHEVVAASWNRYKPEVVASASADKTIRIWDLRSPNESVSTLRGHLRAIRRLCWSPWSAHQLASVGYDMTLRLWDTSSLDPLICTCKDFTEFSTGLDWALDQRVLAACGWDEKIRLFNLPPPQQ